MIRFTKFSRDRRYRYTLWREWPGGAGVCNFICLNPSIADESKDDPTIRRCIQFAKDWGYHALIVTNVFAWRDTSPAQMKKAPEPIGSQNDTILLAVALEADLVVAAWSGHARHRGRDREVIRLLPAPLYCFGISKRTNCPYHPLYQPADIKLMEYSGVFL